MEYSLPNNKGMTLIEMLMVMVIISILFASFFYIWNTMDIFRKSRDSKRINDLQLLDTALKTILSTERNINLGEENIIYTSLPDSSSTCGSYNLLPLFSPYSYRCQTSDNYLKVDGNGWLPVNFTLGKILTISVLPIDPLNNKDYFYAYQVRQGRYKLTARFETQTNISKMANDGGFEPALYEVGSNLFIPSPHSGLVGYWSFDEGTGTIAKDLSGYGNNGTLLDASSTNADGNTPPQWTTGKVGGALSFDGVDDYVNVENPSSGVLDFGTSSFSYSMWVNFDVDGNVIGNWQLPFWKGGSSYGYAGYDFEFSESNNRLDANISDGSGVPAGYARASYSYNFRDGTWHYIVAVVDRARNTITLFVDAIQRGQTTISTVGSVSNSYPLIIGSPSFPFDGLVDEVRVYNRALSDSEIKVLYDAAK
jgi:prepilin-type N-terminal cleavage/methylation domain-containing protein